MKTASLVIHQSQFPENVRRDLLESLRARRVNHKFHYDSIKQTQKWLALHEQFSPARYDPDCLATYEQSFQAAVAQIASPGVYLIGLGCGGGQKDTRLLQQLKSAGKKVFYAPCDVSVAMVLTARQAALQVLPEKHCFPFVCDLAATDEMTGLLPRAVDARASRLLTFFGMIPNFEPGEILPKLASIVRRKDLLLFSANLAPGEISSKSKGSPNEPLNPDSSLGRAMPSSLSPQRGEGLRVRGEKDLRPPFLSPEVQGENSPKDSRLAPLNLPHPARLSSDSSHSLALPSPLPSDGRGEGQGEVRVPRVHGELQPPRLDAHRGHEPQVFPSPTIVASLSPQRGENSPNDSRLAPLNLPHPAGHSSDSGHSLALPSPLPSDGRGEGQGEVRVPRVHGEGLRVRGEKDLRPPFLSLEVHGRDYTASLKKILPQYDNALTRDWLKTFLTDLGVEKNDGALRFEIQPGQYRLQRIVANFHFRRARRINVGNEAFSFKAGEKIRLFFSYRYTPARLQKILARYKLEIQEQWISQSGEEGIFLCHSVRHPA